MQSGPSQSPREGGAISNYDQPSVVDEYTRRHDLFPCEKYLFDKYIPAGKRLLDLGVGAGRTTAALSGRASSYAGIDFSPRMVTATRKRFPDLRIEVGDARDLSRFGDGSFDIVLFSLNGIDYIDSDEGRQRCLGHCRRVLVPAGTLILSVHNAYNVLCRPLLAGMPIWKKCWRLARAPFASAALFRRIGLSRAFLDGHAYVWDPADGGTMVHLASRGHAQRELSDCGFEVLESMPHDYPVRTGPLTTPWYYYVARKR